jgi:hypothetical protein
MTSEQGKLAATDTLAKVLDRLRDAGNLRAAITVVVVMVAYFGIYTPLSNGIESTRSQLKREQELIALAENVEHLRAQYKSFAGRIPKQSDTKEWVQYVLSGIRQFPLDLATLNCDACRDMGPYKAVVMRIELEGSFRNLDRLLRWLEANSRLFRIDSTRIAPSRSSKDVITMEITLLGVMG